MGHTPRRQDLALQKDVHIGNFVEVKVRPIGNTKAGHLTYIGNCQVGSNVNFWCGDYHRQLWWKEYKTLIGNNVFVGSKFIIPLHQLDRRQFWWGAGSTVQGCIPADAIAVSVAVKESAKDSTHDSPSSHLNK